MLHSSSTSIKEATIHDILYADKKKNSHPQCVMEGGAHAKKKLQQTNTVR